MKKSYQKLEYFSKVFYTQHKGRHRPYLGLVFSNITPVLSSSPLLSPRVLGLIDSGADHTAIPYSIGKSIGLEPVKTGEKLIKVAGVGGDINCVERKCSVFIANELKQEIYRFDETVWWKVPSSEIEQTLKDLINDLNHNLDLQSQSVPQTTLYEDFQKKINIIKEQISSINSSLEGDTLIGRPFFDNFEYIQFRHNDRNKEDRCFFNYKVKESKIINITPFFNPLDSSKQINKIGIIQTKNGNK